MIHNCKICSESYLDNESLIEHQMANHTPEAIEAFGAVRESYSCGMSNTWKTKNSESRIKILRKLGYPHTDAQVLSGLEYNQFSSKLQKQIGESLSKITPIKQKVVAVESEEDKTYKNMYDSYLTTRSSQIKKPMNENLGNLEISNIEWDLDDDKLECKKCGYKINVINDEYAESEANNHIKNVHSKANEDWYEDEDKNVSSVMKYKLVYINGMDFGFQTNSKKEAEDTVDEWNTVFRGEPIKYITQESYYNGGYNADGYDKDGKRLGESNANEFNIGTTMICPICNKEIYVGNDGNDGNGTDYNNVNVAWDRTDTYPVRGKMEDHIEQEHTPDQFGVKNYDFADYNKGWIGNNLHNAFNKSFPEYDSKDIHLMNMDTTPMGGVTTYNSQGHQRFDNLGGAKCPNCKSQNLFDRSSHGEWGTDIYCANCGWTGNTKNDFNRIFESNANEFGDYDVTCSNCEGDGCDKCKNTGKITWTSVIPQKIEEGSIFNESLKTHNDYHRLINSVLTGEILHCSHCSKKFKAQESLDLHYNDVHIDQELRSLIGELKANEDDMDDIMWSNDHKGKVPQWKTPKNRPEWANKNGVSSMYDEIQNIAGADEDYEVDVDEYLKTGEPVQKLPTDKRSYDVELNTNMDDIKDDMDSIEATEWGYSNLSPEAETLQNLDYDLGGYTSYENNEDYKNAIKSKLTYPASQISGSVMGELEDINYHHFIKVLMELGAPKPTGESISNEVSWFECDDCKFIGMTHEDAMKHEQDTGHSIVGAGFQSVIPTFLRPRKSEETELQLARESLTPLDKVDDKSNLTKAFESGASIEDIYSKVGDTTQERAGESELNDIYANVDVKLNLEKY